MPSSVVWARMAPEIPRPGGLVPSGRAMESRASPAGQDFAALVDDPGEMAPTGSKVWAVPEDGPASEAGEDRNEVEEDGLDDDEVGPGLPPAGPGLPLPEVGHPAADMEDEAEVSAPGDDQRAATWAAGGSGPLGEDLASAPRSPEGGPVGQAGTLAGGSPLAGAADEERPAGQGPGRPVASGEMPSAGPSLAEADGAGEGEGLPPGGRGPVEASRILADQSGDLGGSRAGGSKPPDGEEAGRTSIAPPAAEAKPRFDGRVALRAGTGRGVGRDASPAEARLGAEAAAGAVGPASRAQEGSIKEAVTTRRRQDPDPGLAKPGPLGTGRERQGESQEAGQPSRPAPTTSGWKEASRATVAPSHRRGVPRGGPVGGEPEAPAVLASSPGVAGPSLPASADPPVEAHRIARQVAAHPVLRAGGSAEMSLAPEELGHLRLSVETSDAGLRVVIEAARPETADLMRRHVEALRHELRQEGLGSVSVSIGGGDGQRGESAPERGPGRGWSAPSAWMAGPESAAALSPASSATARATGSSGRIDLRF